MQKHLRPLGLLALVVSLGAGCESDAVAPEASVERFAGHLDDRVPALLDHYSVPGAAVGLIHEGERTWTGTYGVADRREDRSVTPETVFRVGSISKSVTAWGVMRLVEQGALRLDAPVAAHVDDGALPKATLASDEVTVRRLLNHTAGLPSVLYPEVPPGDSVPPLEAMLSGQAAEPAARPDQPPGASFRYSNAGYAVLELLIEEATGRPFEAYMRDSVLTPLNMTDATFRRTDAVDARLATGHLVDGTPAAPFVDAVKAPGGLYATVGDVAQFVVAGVSGVEGRPPGAEVLSSDGVQRLYAPTVEAAGMVGLVAEAYGLGHFVELLPNGRRAISHGGHHTGWMVHFYLLPETGDGVVVLTNSERGMPFIADLLGAWATWQGLPSIGLSRAFGWLDLLGRSLLVLLWLGTGWGAWRIGRSWLRGRRTFAPLSARWRRGRLIQVLGAGLLAAGVWYVRSLEVTLVFLPVLSGWLSVAVGGWAGLLVLRSLLPRRPVSD